MPTGVALKDQRPASSKIGAAFFGLMLLAATTLFGQETAKKAVVPDEKVQAKAVALIRDVYRNEYKQAKTPEKKVEFAKKLIEKAESSKDSPADQFVLLRIARDLAAQGGDCDTTFEAVDQMAEGFAVDLLEMKVEALTTVATVVTKEDQQQVVEAAQAVISQAIAQDKYDVADRLGKLALAAARKSRDQALVKQTQASIKSVKEATKAFAEVEAAMKTLEENPVDPDANLAVGKYLCFIKGKWKQGRSTLLLGSDATLKALVLKEGEGVTDSAEQAKLGDDWWKLAEKETGLTKQNLQRRAVFWYEEALPQLTGLAKAKVERRMAVAEETASKSPSATPERSSHAAKVVYLDDLQPIDFKVGWGKMGTHGENCDGGRPGINGIVPVHSLCTVPPSNGSAYVSYRLDGKFATFRATAALAHQSASPLTFEVLGDDRLLWQTEPINLGTQKECKVSVRKCKILTLRVSCSGPNYWGWAFWLDPMFTSGKGIDIAKAIKKEIALPRPGKDGWIVVFRSSDPSIWNSDVNKGKDDFAISLANVPENITFLRMRAAGQEGEAIIPIEKAKLGVRSDNGRFGWNGTNCDTFTARHMGIYCPGAGPQVAVSTKQASLGEMGDAKGFGFGHRPYVDDGQGFTWNGALIPKTVFEISVKSKPLTKTEQKFLLQ